MPLEPLKQGRPGDGARNSIGRLTMISEALTTLSAFLSENSTLLTGARDAFLIFAAVYAVTLAVYFATGLAVTAINARRPDRKIQSGRDGLKRRAVEIRSSVEALAVSSALLSAGYFAQTRGWTIAPLDTGWWQVALMTGISVVLHDAWFYWGHRLLHVPALYRFHAPHHKSVAPTVWSNDSSTTVDTLIEHGYYLVVWFVLPIPPLAVVLHRLFDQISGMIGHSGFEYFASKSARWPFPLICTSFHDLHHSGFRYNYGNFFSIWDRLMGTVDPRYDDMVARMERGTPPAAALGSGASAKRAEATRAGGAEATAATTMTAEEAG